MNYIPTHISIEGWLMLILFMLALLLPIMELLAMIDIGWYWAFSPLPILVAFLLGNKAMQEITP